MQRPPPYSVHPVLCIRTVVKTVYSTYCTVTGECCRLGPQIVDLNREKILFSLQATSVVMGVELITIETISSSNLTEKVVIVAVEEVVAPLLI